MAKWKYTLQLADIWHSDDLTFEEMRDETVRRIKAAPFWDEDDTELVETVEELAETDTPHYFDSVWDAFYDWADAERVWVATF